MPKFPKAIKIAPHKWKVGNRPPDDADGYCDPSTLRIEIRSTIDTQLQCEVMVHELIHAMVINAALRQVTNFPDLEEMIASALAPQLLNLIRDNPALIAELAKAAK